jgi:hypothetical protein
MKIKPAFLVALALLALPLAASTAFAGGGRGWDQGWDQGWDRGCWGSDRGYRHHRHRPAHRLSRDLIRHGDRWEPRPFASHRHWPRDERPWAGRRTFVYADPWW